MAAFEEQDCVQCGVRFGVPVNFTANRRRDKRTFWCPNGHSMSYTESEADELRRERDRLKQDTARLHDTIKRREEERDGALRRASAARGQVTRMKNRAAAGLCPCCNRSFVNLQRHMASKHAGFTVEEAQYLEGATIQ